MRIRTIVFVLLALATAVPVAVHFIQKTSQDPLGETLWSYGYVPLVPPSTLMPVGSLYYIDQSVREFNAICHADKNDLEGRINTSTSWKIQQSLERSGKLDTSIKIDFGWLLKSKAEDGYVTKVQSSLTDVVLQEIPLGPNWNIFEKLMSQKECNDTAMRYVRAGGYVCQGQKILNATAEFKLDGDAQSKLEAQVTSNEIKEIVRGAVESQGRQAVVAKEGRLVAGASLTYGVAMSPLCLAPPDGRFKRVLPRNLFDRVSNYFLFNIVEPLWPANTVASALAQPASR